MLQAERTLLKPFGSTASLNQNPVQTVETNIDVSQRLLHSLVASLYSKALVVEPATVEALLHIADVLKVADRLLVARKGGCYFYARSNL